MEKYQNYKADEIKHLFFFSHSLNTNIKQDKETLNTLFL